MLKKWTAALILAMVLTIGACASLEQLIQKPEIDFESLGTQNLSLSEGTFLFRFSVSNPNPVGVGVDDIRYDLDINGENFISSRLAQGLHLAASGSTPMEIPVTINYMDVFKSLSRFLQSDALDYRLTGSAGVGPLRIPYRTSGKIDLPKMPDITVDGIRIDRLSFNGASLKLVLGLKNPNAFSTKIDGLEYAARLGDVDLAKGTARQTTALTGNGRSTMDVNVNLNFLALGRSARTLLSGSSARCLLTGSMLVDTLTGLEKIPFQFDGQVPFIK